MGGTGIGKEGEENNKPSGGGKEKELPKYTRLCMLSLLKRLKTLLFISEKLFETSKANNALLCATIQVDRVIAWANRMKE